MEKTLGELIDELSVTNIRIWMAEDIKRKPYATDSEIAKATKLTNFANSYRNNLKEAIDKKLGVETGQGSTKLYGK